MVHEQENAVLRQQNGFLEDQLQRALKELRSYQLHYPSADHLMIKEEAENMIDLPSWNTSSSTLTPLICAYDARIEELELCKRSQQENIRVLADQVELLVKENEGLHRDILQGGSGLHNGEEGRALLPESSNFDAKTANQINIIEAKNKSLLERATLAEDSLKKSMEGLTLKENQVQKLMENQKKSEMTIKMLENEVKRLKQGARHCEYQTSDMSGMSSSKKVEGQILELTRELHQSELMILRLNAEINQLGVINAELHADSSRLKKKLQVQGNELNHTHELLKQTTQELETTRFDAAGMVEVMNDMQRQLQESKGLAYGYRDQMAEVVAENERCKKQFEEAVARTTHGEGQRQRMASAFTEDEEYSGKSEAEIREIRKSVQKNVEMEKQKGEDKKSDDRAKLHLLQRRLMQAENKREKAEVKCEKMLKDMMKYQRECARSQERLLETQNRVERELGTRRDEHHLLTGKYQKLKQDYEFQQQELSETKNQLRRTSNLLQQEPDRTKCQEAQIKDAERITTLRGKEGLLVHGHRKENKKLSTDVRRLVKELERTKHAVIALQDDLCDSNRKLCEISAQLSKSLGDQHRLCKEKARLKAHNQYLERQIQVVGLNNQVEFGRYMRINSNGRER